MLVAGLREKVGRRVAASRIPHTTPDVGAARTVSTVLPGGFIGIRDQYYISRVAFETRCEKAVDMGVAWCILIDQERRELLVFRADGTERVTSTEGWRLRDFPSSSGTTRGCAGPAKATYDVSFKDVLQRPNIDQSKTEARMEVKSTAMARRDDWIPTADPLIRWPGQAGTLAAIIPDLVRLNPHRDLRLLRQVDEDGEFLCYAGSALDVLTIALPKPFSDHFMSDLTDSNKDWVGYQTDTGVVRVGPRRFERTSSGDLL